MPGKPAARVGDMTSCPLSVGGPILPAGEPTVLIGGLPAARLTDPVFCAAGPDTIACASTSVIIGGLMAARLTDITAHRGVIVSGAPTVLIGEKFGSKYCLTQAAQAGAAFVKNL